MQSLSNTIARVAEYTSTLDVEEHDWQRAIAVNGLFAAEAQPEWVRTVLDRAIETQTSAGQFAYGYGNYPKAWKDWTDYDVETYNPTINSAALADGVLELFERTGERRYLDAVKKQYDFYDRVGRTADGGISRRLERTELWTETLSFYCPFVARLGHVLDDHALIEESVEQALVHLEHLKDDRADLCRHIWCETPNNYPESSFWSRANGWAVAGLLDTLAWIPAEHPHRGDLESSLYEILKALCPLQDESGFFHQVLDDTMSPLETSGTLIFAYAYKKSVEEGLFEEPSFLEAAENGMAAALGVTDSNGAVHRVSKPPASARSPLGVTPYGQGWFLLAATQFR